MAARRGTGTRAETIHCDICGEDYAVTYKRCPFCDGRPTAADGSEEDGRRNGGKRLSTNTRLRRRPIATENHRHCHLAGPDCGGGLYCDLHCQTPRR